MSGSCSIAEIASCRPSGQPSVASCRCARSSREMRSPRQASRIAIDSSSRRCRSCVPTAPHWPFAASSDNSNGRATRVPIATCRLAGALSSRYWSAPRTLSSGRRSASSITRPTGVPRAAIAASNRVRPAYASVVPAAPSSGTSSSTPPTRRAWPSASAKRAGWSAWPAVNQATLAPLSSHQRRHCNRSVVLPKPAGAVAMKTTRSWRVRQASRRWARSIAARGRRGGVALRTNSDTFTARKNGATPV